MRTIALTFILTFLTACSTYQIKDAGEGVYYAESPPEYSYVYGHGYGWPSWYGSYYYPFYSSCGYAPYISPYCGWRSTPYFRYSYFVPPYYGDFAVSRMYPADYTGYRKSGKKRVVSPVAADRRARPSMVDAMSAKYGTSRKYGGTKAYSGKSGFTSAKPSFGNRSMKSPARSYSRPASSSRAPGKSISAKRTVPRDLD
jgi:hypothetical protein